MLRRTRVPLAASEPVELSTPARERIAAEIERHLSAADTLIVLLDRADGDPDLEDNAVREQCSEDEGACETAGACE